MALNPKTRTEYFIAGREGELPIGSRDPETRIEFFLAGREDELPAGHQEPESRLEHFIKDYRSGGDVTVIPLTVTENGDYTAPEGKAYSPVAVSVALPEDAYIKKSIPSTPTAIANFTDGAEMVMPSLTVGVDAWQEGSGDPSPSNIRPIHGWNEVNVGVSGRNLCNPEECASVQKDADGGYRNGIVISKVGTYTIKSYNNTESNIYIYYKIIENGEYGTTQIIQQGTVPGPPKTVTITEGKSIVIYDAIDESLNKSKEIFKNIQIELGTTASEYEPYNGSITTIDLNGTRYGGRVDLVSGVMTVDRVAKVFDGSENWQKSSSGNMYYLTLNPTTFPYEKNNPTYNIANSYKFKGFATSGYFAFLNDGEYLLYNYYDAQTVREIAIKNLSVSTVEDFKSALSSNNLQIVYEITPITIQLTPTAIKSLEGVNNLFADSGEILEGEYLGGVS